MRLGRIAYVGALMAQISMRTMLARNPQVWGIFREGPDRRVAAYDGAA